jgi:hypothetical protein
MAMRAISSYRRSSSCCNLLVPCGVLKSAWSAEKMFSISDACDASPAAPYIAVTDHCLSRPLAELMRRTFNYVPEVMRCTLASYSPHLLGRQHQNHANAHVGKRDGTSAPRAMAPSTNTQPALLIGPILETIPSVGTQRSPAPGLGSSPPHRHRDWARRCHICTGTGLAAATSAPGLGSPPATSAPGLGSSPPAKLRS